MIVRCETCQTEFSLDDAHVGRDGVTVRCSVCAHVFHVASPSSQDIGERPWQIRTRDGLLFSANDLEVLQRWIGEGRLHPEDEVSRTGNRWVRIGEMPELSSHFARFAEAPSVLQVVDDQRGTQKYTAASNGQSSSVFFAPPGQAATYAGHRGSETSPMASAYGERTAASGGLSPSAPGQGPTSLASFPQGAYPPESLSPQDSSASTSAHHPPVQYNQVSMSSPRQITARMNPHLEGRGMAGGAASHEETSWALSSQPHLESPNAPVSSGPRDNELSDSLASLHYPPQSRSGNQGGTGLRASYWGVLSLAAVAILVAVAVRFISHSREQASSLAHADSKVQNDEASPQSITPQLQAVTKALNSMSLGEMRDAEQEVQQRLDGDRLPDSSLRLSLQLALADLLSSRSLLFSMVGSLEAERGEEYRNLANSDLERASRLFDAVEIAGVSADQLLPIRTRIQLAKGASISILNEELPNRGAAELRALVNAASVWRNSDQSEVPKPSILEKIQEIQNPSGLMRCVHALVLVRSKDGEGLARVLAKLAELAVDNPLIASLQKSGVMPSNAANSVGNSGSSMQEQPPSGALFDPAKIAAAIDQARQKNHGKAPVNGGRDVADNAPKDKSPSKTSSASSEQEQKEAKKSEKKSAPVEERFDSLLDRGCTMVERGQAASGVKVLLRALEKRSQDIETLLCLGDGYAKMGQSARSLTYFERVLRRSPRHRLALRGAATAAASQNDKVKALRYYEKLLQIEPRNSLAKTYINVHGSNAPPPSPASNAPTRQPQRPSSNSRPPSPSQVPTNSTNPSQGRTSPPPPRPSSKSGHDGLPAPD